MEKKWKKISKQHKQKKSPAQQTLDDKTKYILEREYQLVLLKCFCVPKDVPV